MTGIQQYLNDIMATAFDSALQQMFDQAETNSIERPINPMVQSSQHADFQANAAIGLSKRLKMNPQAVASAVVNQLKDNEVIESAEVAGPGFINLMLSKDWLADQLSVRARDNRLGVPPVVSKTIVVDYSAPNVAKEMHVGHLRSTIIGDACVRLMDWLGHNVVRRNHIGDWGTPFGMLIEHLNDIGETQAAQDLSQGDLNQFYRAASAKFESSEVFQNRARQRVVSLQSGEQESLRLWKILIDQSKQYFISVYEHMDVRLDGTEFYGESSYNDVLQSTLEELKHKQLIQQSDGADCLFPAGFYNRDKQPLPLIVRKRDGGFGYAATDLAALLNRTQDLNADRILYVVGTPQQQHLEMIFEAGRMSGWLAARSSAEHIKFGSVLDTEGKMFKSRSGDTIKLANLLEEAVKRAESVIEQKNPKLTQQQRQQVAYAVGIGAIKYADLSNERTRDYIFDFDQMLAFEGNTAPYLQYANARIQSVLREAGDDTNTACATILLHHEAERKLAILLLKFPDSIKEVADSLLFHRLAGYLYGVATAFSKFYSQCPVLSAEETASRESRIEICRITSRVLTTGLSLLGIRAPDRM